MVGPAAEAYIIMRADGTLIPRDVKSFAKDAGEEFGEEFSGAVDEEIEKAGKAGIKRFHQRLGRSIAEVDFKPLQRKGEALDAMFGRLSDSVEALFDSGEISVEGVEKFADSFDEWAESTRKVEEAIQKTREENELLAISTRNAADDSLLAARASLESAKARGKDQRAVESLGERLDVLADKQREWMDRAIEAARTSDNWEPYIKKMGGMDRAMDTLRRRTDEVRDSTDVYNNVLAEAELSLGRYIESVKVKIAEEEKAKRLEQERKDAAKDLLEVEKENAKQSRINANLERERERELARLGRTINKVTDESREMLDALIFDSTHKSDWSQMGEYVREMGYNLDTTGNKAKSFAAIVDVVTERMEYLHKEGAITDEAFRKVTDSLEKFHAEVSSGRGQRLQFIEDMDAIGDRVGRTFGKGSRNDFLNFFGGLIGGLTKFAAKTPVKIFNGLSDAVDVFGESFDALTTPIEEGGKGMGKMAGGARALAMAFGSLAKGGITAVAAVVAISQAAGALASAISLTGGLLTIFGRAVYLSVAAPLLAAVPALVSFGTGALVAGGAISKWAEDSKPLKKALSGISSELEKVAKKITPAMDGLAEFFGEKGQSVVRMFGDSVQNVLQDLYDKLDDPAMQKFYDAWSAYMPDIFESLGKSISSFTTGLTAFFVPILPYAEKLANAIERTADRFAEWAQSSEGQNSIRDWMDNAWQTATDLWSGLRDIGSALGNIFGMADEEGGGFAKWIKDIGERFEKWTESEEGRESIKQWLKDAKEFGKDLKGVIESLGKAFDTLDSPAGRDALGFFMTAFQLAAGGAQMFASALDGVNRAISSVGNWLNENLYGFDTSSSEGWAQTWTEEVEMWKGYVDNIKGWWDGAWKWVEDINFTEMWNGFTSSLSDWWSSVGTWFSDKGTSIKETVKGWFDVDWSGIWETVKTGISDGWDSVWSWLTEQGSSIKDTVVGWFDIDWSGMFSSAGEAIETFFNDMVRNAGFIIGRLIRTVLDAPGQIRDGWDAAWKWVEDIEWGEMWDGLVQGVKDAFNSAVSWVRTQWDAAWNWVEEIEWGEMWDGMVEGIKGAFDSAVSWVRTQWDAAWNWVEEIEWGKMWDGIVEAVKAPFNDAWNWIRTQWDAAWEWVENIEWGQMWDGMVDGLREKWNAVWKFFEDIDWTGIWEDIKSGISEGLESIGNWLLEKGTKLFDSFIQGIKDGLGIASPSQKMIELMGYVGDGILNGLTAIPGKILSAVTTIATGIVDGIRNGLSTVGTVVSEKFDAAKTAVTTKASEIGSAVSSKFGEMPGKARDALANLGSNVSSKFEEARSGAVSKANSLVSDAKSGLSKMGSTASTALSDLGSKVSSRFEDAKGKAKSLSDGLVSGAKGALSKMGNSASTALNNLSPKVGSRFDAAKSNANRRADQLVTSARSKLSRMGSQASSALSNLSSNIGSRFNSAKSNAVNIAGNIASGVRSKMAGIPGLIRSALSGVSNAITSPFSSAKSAVERIVGQIRSLASQAASLASNISVPGPGIPWFATGGIVSGARVVGVGEAGPEAIVPLDRPLSQVDPSVRWLSAIAQGLSVPSSGRGGATIQSGAIQVITPYSNPELVANQVLDGIVANL